MDRPYGIGHIGKEQYQNEMEVLIAGVKCDCEKCGKEFMLEGGIKALIDDFDQPFICSNCEAQQ